MKAVRLEKELETKSPRGVVMTSKISGRPSKLCHDRKMRCECRWSREHYRRENNQNVSLRCQDMW